MDAVRRLRGFDGVGAIEFDSSDVVRHELVSKIVRAYEKGESGESGPRGGSRAVSDEQAGGAVSWSDEALGSGEERPLSDGRVGEAVAAAAADQGLEALEVDVVFVSAAELAKMHGTFLDDPTETDVITFDLRDPDLVDAPGPTGSST